jgi:hypothetical protein
MAIVICGFPGVGKSCVANNRKNIIDAESSAYSWSLDFEHPENGFKRNPAFPSNYIQSIKGFIDKYEYVLVSSHKEVRVALGKEGIPYIIVAPKRELKNEYLIRYLQRGNEMDLSNRSTRSGMSSWQISNLQKCL